MMQHLSLEKFCPYSEDAKNGGWAFLNMAVWQYVAVREVFEESFLCDRVQRGACMSLDDRSICMA